MGPCIAAQVKHPRNRPRMKASSSSDFRPRREYISMNLKRFLFLKKKKEKKVSHLPHSMAETPGQDTQATTQSHSEQKERERATASPK